eukprot:CAMPEP_0174290628 /NCGR_PEP_ID=MMETSP0809-20121228/29574_1 /TAXON_ID=73025 ORGANISM="Eutreptiella gymnastica-like, Strain CCMP1594" /NCGR_SAMPLE_ID=MMETSP0809 /ASSEMBLY_ACC=CAM_ASM_000658 /LENGTH=51 /DNA_ID=CAMNT_0015389441 /DNA_START=700 /DNA_END=855 /DNA_ORIENTATION=-
MKSHAEPQPHRATQDPPRMEAALKARLPLAHREAGDVWPSHRRCAAVCQGN